MGENMKKNLIKKAMSLLEKANETSLVSVLKRKIEKEERIKSLKKDYSLSESEIGEVLSVFEGFNGSLDLYDVEEWNAEQRKLLIDLFNSSDVELYDDGNYLLDYNTLSERVMDEPHKYFDYCDWEDIILEHFYTVDIKEIVSNYGCCEHNGNGV